MHYFESPSVENENSRSFRYQIRERFVFANKEARLNITLICFIYVEEKLAEI